MASYQSSKFEDDFLCAVCLDVFLEPYSVEPCGHVFCKSCIESVQESSYGSVCPTCRGEIDDIDFDHNVQSQMDDVKIPCTNCQTLVAVASMREHRDAFECIPPEVEEEATDGNAEKIESTPPTYTCPFCQVENMSLVELTDHCNSTHDSNKRKVVCPVCAKTPWGDQNQLSRNFVKHLNMRHKFDYIGFVDFGQDDDAMLSAAIQESLMTLTS